MSVGLRAVVILGVLFGLDLLRGGAGASSAFAQEQPVVVNGDRVEYQTDLKRVVAFGHVVVTRDDVVMTCDRMVLMTDTNDAYAEGHVRVSQNDFRMEADRMLYNFESKSGQAIDTNVAVPGELSWWYGHGGQVDKPTDYDLIVRDGYLTSCNFGDPHYRIRAKRFDVYMDDKVVARSVVFQVGKYPVFYLPKYTYSLKDDKPNITIIPGKKKDWGPYVLTAARYELNHKAKGYIWNDYRSDLGYAHGVDYLYETEDWGEGKLRWYRAFERRRDRPQDQSAEAYRWRVQYRHKGYILDDEDNLLTLEFHKQKDVDFLRDYYDREEFEVESNPLSYASFVRTKPAYAVSLLVQPRANRFASQVEYLPQVQWDVRSQPIWRWFSDTPDFLSTDDAGVQQYLSLERNWWKDFYYTGQKTFSVLTNEYASPTTRQEDAVRFHSDDVLSYPVRLWRWLSVTPKVGMTQVWYDRRAADSSEDVIRGQFKTGLDLSTKFYRIFDYTGEPLGMPINRLRHVITPTLGYEYAPDPTFERSRLTSFDGLDSFDRRHTVSLSFENKLQTKRMASVTPFLEEDVFEESETDRAMEFLPEDEGEKKFLSVDLIRFILSGGYSFKPENGSRYTTVTADLEVQPFDWMTFESDATYNPETLDIDTVNFDFFTRPSIDRRWRFGLGHRYQNDSTTQWTMDWTYFLSEKWKFRIFERFNWKRIKPSGVKRINELVEQEYSLIRDLHCWTAELNYNITRDSGEAVFVIFRSKAFPEMPVNLETSYHVPKPNSQTNP